MPDAPLSTAEALFVYALQPLLDLAALGPVAMALAGIGVGFGGGAGAVAWLASRVRAAFSVTILPDPMIRTLSLLAALLLAAPAFAQTHADPMARLAPFAGTYALDGVPHEAPGGSFDGTLTVTPILDGTFQQWDWQMDMRGDGVSERALLRFIVGYDVATRSYTIHRFDSRDVDSPTRSAGALDSPAGRLQVDGDALVMAWTMNNPDDAARMGTFRNRVRVTSGGLHVETEAVPDDGSPVVAIATTRAARQ